MTTPKTSARTLPTPGRFRLPDPPRREPDEMTQYDRLFKTGNSRYLAIHLGNPDTTLVEADRWIVPDPSFNKARARRPDLLVAFGVDPDAYELSNGYIVSEQGKPPDFVLEVASESTAEVDVGEKRRDYASSGNTGILAVRRDGDGPVSRGEAGRRAVGEWGIRCDRD